MKVALAAVRVHPPLEPARGDVRCAAPCTPLFPKSWEEVRAEALVRNLPGYARFLPVAALCHGQIVNITNLARESGVARTTVEGYLQILEDTLLCFRIPEGPCGLRGGDSWH